MNSMRKLVLIFFGAMYIVAAIMTYAQIGEVHKLREEWKTPEALTFEGWVETMGVYGAITLLLIYVLGIEDTEKKSKKN